MKHIKSSVVDTLRNAPMIPVLIIVALIFSFTTDGFLSAFSLQNLLRDTSVLAVAALGGMLVFLVSGLDLSVGSTVAGSAVAAALVSQSTGSLTVAVFAGLGVGLVVGIINGLLIGYAKLVPFILTLGMMLIVSALAYLAVAMSSDEGDARRGAAPMLPEATAFGRGVTFGLPNVFYVAAIAVIVIAVVLARTRFGRKIRLIGQNEEAARFSGIDVALIKLLVYTIAGFLSGLAGVLLAFRLGSGSPAAGDALLLQVITAVIIGGTALTGGHGGAFRTLFGALVIIAIDRGLSSMGVQFWDQQIVLGLVILLGTQINRRWSGRRRLA